MKFRFAGLFAIGLMAGAVSSPAQSYNIIDLGSLPGDNTTVAAGLNGLGQAVGTCSNPSGAIATLFSNGRAINLGTLGPADASFAEAINGSGQVVGYDWLSSGVAHAFVYSNGRMVDIHSASLFPSGSTALGINNSGEVVGYGWINSAHEHAFLYAGGRTVDLGTLGGSDAVALAINDAGEVVGNSTTASGVGHAFLYSNGRIADLGVPAGASSSSAVALNSTGQIVGVGGFSSSSHAALYSNGVWTDLGAVPGATIGTMATGINDSGEIVGWASFPAIPYKRAAKRIGFIVQNGALVDLTTLIPANSGLTITGAVGINDLGEILCNAKTSAGGWHTVLLTPK